jgi:hypothetical protein
VLRHARPGVEVQPEGRPERVVEILSCVQDELEPANRARERGMREGGGELLALGTRQPDRRHDLDVEVARGAIEVTERAGTEQPRADEAVAQPVVEVGD